MHDVTAARRRARQGGGVGQVAGHHLGVQSFQVAPVAGRPRQQPQRVASPRQHPRDGGADEAGGARDQSCHAAFLQEAGSGWNAPPSSRRELRWRRQWGVNGRRLVRGPPPGQREAGEAPVRRRQYWASVVPAGAHARPSPVVPQRVGALPPAGTSGSYAAGGIASHSRRVAKPSVDRYHGSTSSTGVHDAVSSSARDDASTAPIAWPRAFVTRASWLATSDFPGLIGGGRVTRRGAKRPRDHRQQRETTHQNRPHPTMPSRPGGDDTHASLQSIDRLGGPCPRLMNQTLTTPEFVVSHAVRADPGPVGMPAAAAWPPARPGTGQAHGRDGKAGMTTPAERHNVPGDDPEHL